MEACYSQDTYADSEGEGTLCPEVKLFKCGKEPCEEPWTLQYTQIN